jgi:arylsulfatase A-like enzyme
MTTEARMGSGTGAGGAWRALAALAIAISALAAAEVPAGGGARPNVIIILADDLGYGDLGCYGQQLIRTPNLDRLAAEGVRFTQAYAGTTVCAPSRCALMTGLHSGHGAIRANRELEPEGQQPLPAGTFTVAQLCKDAGYATAAFGKWGLGGVESSGAPDLMGFTDFFGYNCQRRAHNYFPDHLWRNHERVPLDGRTYSPDLITAQALSWLRAHAQQPFFLFLPTTLPHAEYQVPDVGAYAQEAWPAQLKAYASMVTRMDAAVGEVCALVKELGIDDRTLILFTSDQGADLKGALETFHSNGPFRGIKRSMYEGGLRVPAIARWPGRIAPGTRNGSAWAFYDLLPTVAELIGRPLPTTVKTDGLSILPALLDGKAIARPFLYWELHEGPFIQAVRAGAWKGVRNGPGKPLELYDLDADGAEAHDLAAAHPEVVTQLEAILQREHVPDPLWPDRAAGKAAGARAVDAR